MPRTDFVYLTFHRVNFVRGITPVREQEWNDWFDNVHLGEMSKALGAWTATRWKVNPTGANGPQYAALYQIEGADAPTKLAKLQAEWPHWWTNGRIHPEHTTILSTLVQPYGRWGTKRAPSASVKAHHLVFSTANDPNKLEEWDQWYQDVHSPDAISTGAFTTCVRCRPVPPPASGSMQLNWSRVTIYDIENDEVEKTDALAGSRIEQWRAAGRIHPNMCGVYNLVMKPTGKWAPLGLKAP